MDEDFSPCLSGKLCRVIGAVIRDDINLEEITRIFLAPEDVLNGGIDDIRFIVRRNEISDSRLLLSFRILDFLMEECGKYLHNLYQ